MRIRAATRGSALARWQVDRLAELLATVLPDVTLEPVVVETAGDRDQVTPLDEMGGQGVFVKEVQAAVLDGRADVAVHSAKDLPAATPDGLVLAAVPERADARDALVGCRWADLGPGATVATGSIRRRAHLSHLRPDLAFSGLRGNIETRLSKAEGFDAVVVAAAALDRLGLVPDIVDRLDSTVLLPQVAQGALAVECRSGDVDVGEVLKAVEDPVARRAVDAERAFLAELGAGCDLPIAAHAVLDGDEVVLIGALSSSDGSVLIREQRQSVDGERLGRAVARHLLDDRGGIRLMEAG